MFYSLGNYHVQSHTPDPSSIIQFFLPCILQSLLYSFDSNITFSAGDTSMDVIVTITSKCSTVWSVTVYSQIHQIPHLLYSPPCCVASQYTTGSYTLPMQIDVGIVLQRVLEQIHSETDREILAFYDTSMGIVHLYSSLPLNI